MNDVDGERDVVTNGAATEHRLGDTVDPGAVDRTGVDPGAGAPGADTSLSVHASDRSGTGGIGTEPTGADQPGVVEVGIGDAPTEQLEGEAVDLASRIAAATARFLVIIGELDARAAHQTWGCRTAAHWLAWKCGIDVRTAREQVRVARALRGLPVTAAEFAAGRLSYSKVRAITRSACPATEADLVQMAEHATAGHVERIARGVRRVAMLEQVSAAERHARRSLRWWWDDDGSLVLTARLPPESGAAVLAVLEPIAAELARTEQITDSSLISASDPLAASDTPTSERPGGDGFAGELADVLAHDDAPASTPATDHAPAAGDALADGPIASPHIDHSLHEPHDDVPDEMVDTSPPLAPWWKHPAADPFAQRHADALVEAMHRLAHGRGGVRAEIRAVVDVELLGHDGPGRCHLLDGPALDHDTLELLRCDATVTALLEAEGAIVASGPRLPAIPTATRRAVLTRDMGCVFPDCPGTHVQLHHVHVRAHNGAHTATNLVALCGYHHRRLHREGWTVVHDGRGRVRFVLPDGRVVRHDLAVASGDATAGSLPAAPGGPTAVDSAWAGEHLDVHDTVAELVRRAQAARHGAAGNQEAA
jgi:hypothetical protein